MSNSGTLIITAVAAHFLALLSPGPDFLLVVKSGIRNEKRNAIGIAFGIASANGVYISLCIIGLGKILAEAVIIMKALKICGGIFLIYLACSAVRAKMEDYELLFRDESVSGKMKSSFIKEFITGFTSGISNPKNLVFYLSLFSLVLTGYVSLWVKLFLGIWMTCVVFLWDAFIITVLSHKRIRMMFKSRAYYFDKFTAIVLGVTGYKLIESVFKTDTC